MKEVLLHITLLFFIISNSCESNSDVATDNPEEEQEIENKETGLVFIDEYIVPADFKFKDTRVGGLSGIDYANGKWYLISDDPNTSRFYTAAIAFNSKGYSDFKFTSVVRFKDAIGTNLNDGIIDPEAIRIDGDKIVWTSEGNIDNDLAPSVNFSSTEGFLHYSAIIPSRYNDFTENSGPRQNGAFEGLTLSADGKGYWVAMELPLKQDGLAPTTTTANSYIRVAYMDKITGKFGKEYAYKLDAVARAATAGTSFELNGVVEILAVSSNRFLFLERSFATGYVDGGYTIKIYEVDISNATDVSKIGVLKNANFNTATKTLLLDFEDIRQDLTNGFLYNMEGMSFGPNFKNGNKSLLVVADNNFNTILPEFNQFILLEWKKKG